LKHFRHLGSLHPEQSPPARGRGLKPVPQPHAQELGRVAPRTGAWIETKFSLVERHAHCRRPPHGGVD